MLAALRSFVGRRPVLVAAIALGLLALSLSGCAGRTVRIPAVEIGTTPSASAAESADAKVRRLEGELHQARLERDDARLAGARRLLNWSTGILALCAVGLLVAAIYLRAKSVGMAALACAGGAAGCQVFQRALDHIQLISWLSLAAVLAVGGWMAWRYHKD